MDAKVGVISAAEVNVPVNGGPSPKMFDLKAPSTWATIWLVVAVLFLLKVL